MTEREKLIREMGMLRGETAATHATSLATRTLRYLVRRAKGLRPQKKVRTNSTNGTAIEGGKNGRGAAAES